MSFEFLLMMFFIIPILCSVGFVTLYGDTYDPQLLSVYQSIGITLVGISVMILILYIAAMTSRASSENARDMHEALLEMEKAHEAKLAFDKLYGESSKGSDGVDVRYRHGR